MDHVILYHKKTLRKVQIGYFVLVCMIIFLRNNLHYKVDLGETAFIISFSDSFPTVVVAELLEL